MKILGFAIVALLLAGCVGGEPVGNLGGRDIYAECDRGNLLYSNGYGLAVVANAPSCQGAK